MKTTVGVWIDHRKAVIVAVTNKGEETRLIISKAEKQLRRSGDPPLRVPMNRCKCRKVIAARKRLRDSQHLL